MSDMVQFMWPRATGRGYQWRDLRIVPSGDKVRALTTGAPIGEGPLLEPTFPLKHSPMMFRVFADTETSESAIKEFADRFGPLKNGTMGGLAGRSKSSLYHGDSLGDWLKAIREVHMTLRIWDMTLDKNETGLQKHIKWNANNTAVNFKYRTRKFETDEVIASTKSYPETFDLFQSGDLIMPAKIQSIRLVNRGMAGNVTPSILWDREHESFGLHITPRNLLGAIWFQVGQTISLGTKFQTCPQCNQWFEVTRKDKQYCSTKCRVRSHQAKIERGEKG